MGVVYENAETQEVIVLTSIELSNIIMMCKFVITNVRNF